MKKPIFILWLLLSFFTLTSSALAGIIYEIPIKGDITSARANLVEEGIRRGEQAGAQALLFSIDTFGGEVAAALRIKRAIVNSSLPTIALVEDRAWSAGALITLSAEDIMMTPGSSMGAAETRPLEEKYISALRGEFMATAEMRDRDPELAQAMVDVDVEIEGVISQGKLLTLTASQALKLQMADYVTQDVLEGLEALGYTRASLVTDSPSLTERFAVLAFDPVVSTLLITGGLLGIYGEFITPGFALPGTLGVLSLSLFFSSRLIAGAFGYGIVLLFLAGLFLLALEIFVIPGFGVPGIGGVVAIIFSLFVSFDNPRQALQIISISFLITVILAFFLFRLFGRSSAWKRLVLSISEEKELGYIAPVDRKALQGKEGIALTPLRPAGVVSIDGERFDVVTEGDFIQKGEGISVIRIDGNRVVVKRLEK